jgi:DHA1 family bicyclomycin/chloramphenicol resistance-like MFS transporter
MPLLVLSTFCFGLAAPSATRATLDPIPKLAGIAGGLLTSVQMLCGAASSSLVALLFPAWGMLAMSGVMALCAVLAACVWFWLGTAASRGAEVGSCEAGSCETSRELAREDKSSPRST